MPTTVDTSGVFDTVLPNVYVKKILLLPTTEAGSRRGLEYDTQAPDRLVKDFYGKKRPAENMPRFDALSRNANGLKVEIQLVIKDMYHSNGLTGWLERPEIMEYLKLRVVLSENEQLTSDLLSRNFTPNYLRKVQAQNQFMQQVVDLKKIYKSKLSEQPKSMVDGEEVHDVVYTVSFFVDQLEPKDLTVFVNTFADTNEFLRKNKLTGVSERQIFQGNTIAQHIIRNKQIQDASFMYLLPDGKVWAGPVHRHPEGGFMAGAFHTSNPHPRLSLKRTTNFIIEDHRLLSDMQNVSLSLVPHREANAPEGGIKSSESLTIPRQNAYIAEPMYSSDAKNIVKFVFHVNYDRLVRDNTEFGALLDNVDSSARNKIFERSNIKNVSVYRVRVQKGLQPGSLKEVEYEDRTELIAEASENITGNLQPNSVTRSIETQDIESETITVGAIREVKLSSNIGVGIRSFGVTDYDMELQTDGLYRYVVEMEVEDGTKHFAKEQLSSLSMAKNLLEEYYAEASRIGNTVPETGKFTQDFIDQKREQYSIPTEEEVANNNFREANTIRRQSIAFAPWLSAICSYVDSLYNLTNMKREKVTSIGRLLYRLCSPETGTPQGLELLLNSIQRIENLAKAEVGTLQTKPEEIDFSEPTRAFGGSKKINSFKFSKRFKTVHDSNVQKDVGYDFLGGTDRKSVGPRIMSVDQYIKRMNSENDKYFSVPYEELITQTDVTGDETAPNYSVGMDLQNQFYSFLTPATLMFGEKNELSTIDRGAGLWDSEQYSSMITSVLSVKTLVTSPEVEIASKIDPRQPTYDVGPPMLFGKAWKKDTSTVSLDTFKTNVGNSVLLGKMNVVVSSKASYESKIGKKDTQDGLERNINHTVDPKEVLGQSTKFATDPIEVEDQVESEETYNNRIELVSDVVELSSTIVSPLVASRDKVFTPISRGAGRKIEDLVSSNNKNIVDKHFENLAGGPQKKEQFLRALPNQLKSLLLTESGVVRKNWSLFKEETGKDILKSADLYGVSYMLYNHINKIEVLSGFEKSKQGNIMVKKPVFRKITKEILDQISEENLTMLCRMVPYSNSVIGFSKSGKMNLPEFDSIFIVQSATTQPEESTSNTATFQTVNATSDAGVTDDVYTSRVTQTVDLNETGISLMKSIIAQVQRQDEVPPEFSNTAQILQPRIVARAGTTFGPSTTRRSNRRSQVVQAQNATYRGAGTSDPLATGGSGRTSRSSGGGNSGRSSY